jgi:hypothetical protein
METGLTESHDLRIPRAPHRPQEVQIGHRLEEVGLALAVIPDDRDTARREGDIGMSEIPEIARLEPAKPMVRVPILRV